MAKILHRRQRCEISSVFPAIIAFIYFDFVQEDRHRPKSALHQYYLTTPPRVSLESLQRQTNINLRMIVLPGRDKSWISLAVSIEYMSVTDGRTDGQQLITSTALAGSTVR